MKNILLTVAAVGLTSMAFAQPKIPIDAAKKVAAQSHAVTTTPVKSKTSVSARKETTPTGERLIERKKVHHKHGKGKGHHKGRGKGHKHHDD